MKEQKFRKLEIWKRSIDLVSKIYKETEIFPANEIYGLTAQIRRAAVSVSLNIAEGSGAASDLEFKRFLNISLRSTYEVMCAIEISYNLKYLKQEEKDFLLKECDILSGMIGAFIKKLKADSR